MKNAKFNIDPVNKLLDKHYAHDESYIVDFCGIDLVIHPKVFNPNYTKVSKFFADNINIDSGSEVLDMFTGSGAIAFATASDAKKVVGVDISPLAISCARENADRLKLSQFEFRQGDLWEVVKDDEKFDVILSSPPFLPATPETLLEKAVVDSLDMSNTIKFMKEAPQHLKDGGKILMSFSNACKIVVGDEMEFITSLADEVRLDTQILAELNVGYEVYRVLMFVFK